MENISNPWTTLSTQTLYDNPWIRVDENKVINPNGGEGIYGKVHFKNKAIGIIPLDEKGFTYLVGQYRYTLNAYSWEIPMGGGSPDEELLVSAQKELKEETGLKAKKWIKIADIHTSNSVTDEEGFIFLAQELESGDTEWEETELLEIKKLHWKEAVQMVLQGKITDAISMVGLLKLPYILK